MEQQRVGVSCKGHISREMTPYSLRRPHPQSQPGCTPRPGFPRKIKEMLIYEPIRGLPGGSQNVPFVLGTSPPMAGSMATAARSARPNALNAASHTW